jgi:esterase FrsA
MNDVAELKRFGLTHARAQKISAKVYRQVCECINTDDGNEDGSWAFEWSSAGHRLEERGNQLAASGYYNLARFPYVDGPARKAALDRCVATFRDWSADKPAIERLSVDLPEGTVNCWAGGLSAENPAPLLIIIGGIVSVKEQWAPLLASIGRLGMAAVVTELPGVGENATAYTAESWRMLSTIADAVADRADVRTIYTLAFSFGGHMALRSAAHDRRIRGIVTAGAPISHYFTDKSWHELLPGVTVDTLAHLTRTPATSVTEHMSSWGLSPDELRALDIPVYYVASRRDEIVPAADIEWLRQHVSDLRLHEYDDDHQSPRYATETRAWIMHALLQLRGGRPVQRAITGTIASALSGRRRITEWVR